MPRLVLNWDPDTNAAEHTPQQGPGIQSLLQFLASLQIEATPTDTGATIDGGQTKIHVIRWESHDRPQAGVPNQQTLERLVCSAVSAAYPTRANTVQEWLDRRPDAPPLTPKEYSWSHMAGWYAQNGCEDFYRCIWDDPAIAEQLELRLRASGAWNSAASIAA